MVHTQVRHIRRNCGHLKWALNTKKIPRIEIRSGQGKRLGLVMVKDGNGLQVHWMVRENGQR